MVGVSCSLAFNGNSELCFKTSSFAKLSSLSSFALEPIKQSLRFVGVRLPSIYIINYIKNLEMVGVEPTSIVDKN